MGMTANQLSLVRYVAENNLSKAKQAAIACCAEDTTQKIGGRLENIKEF